MHGHSYDLRPKKNIILHFKPFIKKNVIVELEITFFNGTRQLKISLHV